MKFLHPEPDKCKGVRACEKACSTTFFKVSDPDFSSIQVNKNDSGYNINVCNQCGQCILVCPVSALHRNKFGTVMVNKETCVGCFMCVGFCPTLSMRRAKNQKVPFKCVACGACTKTCPTGAISLKEANHAELPA